MANKRFEMYQYRQILVRMRMGESNRAIAQSGLVGRKKAQKLRDTALEHGWLDKLVPLPDNTQLAAVLNVTVHTPSSSMSSVLPHAEKVNTWIENGVQGSTIHQKLVDSYGFTGSYWAVNRYIKSVIASEPGKVSTVMEFDPGDAVQVDFGAGPLMLDKRTGELRKTWVFVMTLAWSRHMYGEFIWDQSTATWLSCHRRAFEWFNGVPKRVIIDNPKCAITKACYHDPDVQRAYAECAEGYGFLISPCPVRDPQKKGRVESNVMYIKNAFVPLREFRSLSDTTVRIYQQHELKATHGRLRHQGGRSTVPEHQPPAAQAYNMQDPQYCLTQAKKVGEYCHLFIERLFASRVLDNLRAAQGVVGFTKRYGPVRLERACYRALTFDNVRYSAIKQILEKGLDELPHETNAFDSLSDSYTGKGRFHRDPNKLIPH